MTQRATESVVVHAPPEVVYRVATDFEHYLDWVSELKKIDVLERDAIGRPVEVEFRAAAFGRSTTYTLHYDYSRAPEVLSWHQTRGDVTEFAQGRVSLCAREGGDAAHLRSRGGTFRADSRIRASAGRLAHPGPGAARTQSPGRSRSVSNVAIGIDVGGTKALALMVARDGRVIAEMNSQTPHDVGLAAGEATAKVLVEQVNQLCARQSLDPSHVPIGVGLPGMMRRDGHLAYAPNLQTASGADLGAQLGDALGNSQVFCENDANCATLAEHEWGAARGLSDFVMVTLGTGIGGGIVADGQLVRGRSGFAGEIGHMVVEARGAPCLCGGRGCWERYASGGGLHRLTRDAALEGRLPELVARSGGDWRAVRAEDVSQAASEGLDEAVALDARGRVVACPRARQPGGDFGRRTLRDRRGTERSE